MTGPAEGSYAKISVTPSEPRDLIVSVFSTADGRPIGKVRGLDANGMLRKDSRAWLSNGRVEQRRFPTLMSFIEAVGDLANDQALGFGTSEFETAQLVTKDRLSEASTDGPRVARTKVYFSFRRGPGILHVDYDPRPGAPPLSATAVVRLLRAAVPELKNVTICSKPSSSSHLTHPDGSPLVSLSGAHILIPVTDATLIPQIGQTIVDRLWLAGGGWIKITGAGVLLESTIIDQSVLSPERLCFVRAACEDGVTFIVLARDGVDGGEVTLRLSPDGLIASIEASDRPRIEGDVTVERPWHGTSSDYRCIAGRTVPAKAEVSWVLPTGAFRTWEGEVTEPSGYRLCDSTAGRFGAKP